MGKKVEKALSKDKSLTSHADDDTTGKAHEPYKCVGNFMSDFTELCKQKQMYYIPPVVNRPKPPVGATPTDGKMDRKGKGAAITEADQEADSSLNGELVDHPPKTYVTKEKFDYFKPNVQVELDVPEKYDTVTEIFIRGWKVDNDMIEIFQQSWPLLDRLHSINLWNTNLQEKTLHDLAAFLPQCLNLKNIVLDGNPIKEENWHELILEDSIIQNLSLRHCKITDTGAQKLGKTLGTAKLSNTKLQSLNLAGNLIGDSGAEGLAGGLRMNRTLMSLILTNNLIGDKGTEKIAEAISKFSLTHEEVVERRKVMSDRDSMDLMKTPPPSRRGDARDRPGSVRSMTTQDKTAKQKPSAKKKDAKGKDPKEETKTVKKDKEDTRAGTKRGSFKAAIALVANASLLTDASKTLAKTGKDKKKDKGKTQQQEVEPAELQDVINPLTEATAFIDGQVLIPGNRRLINLNLSRNNIGAKGIEALRLAIQYQTTLCKDSESAGTGLKKLSVHKNKVSADAECFQNLSKLMLEKDPFYKSPTPDIEPQEVGK